MRVGCVVHMKLHQVYCCLDVELCMGVVFYALREDGCAVQVWGAVFPGRGFNPGNWVVPNCLSSRLSPP